MATRTNSDAISSTADLKGLNLTWQSLLEAAPDGVVIVNSVHQILFFNTQAEKIFGYSREELKGQFIEILVPDRFQQSHLQECQKYFLNPEVHPMGSGRFLEGCRKDGTQFPAEISLSPIKIGEETWVITVIRDITERTATELALKQSESRFRRISESNLLGVFVGDLEGTITYSNQVFCRLIGFTDDHCACGRLNWKEKIPSEYRLDASALNTLQRTGVSPLREIQYLRNDGRKISVLLGIAMLEGAQDQCVGFMLDNTERKKLEAEVFKARDDLEERVCERTADLQQINEELKKSNKNLEEFAYIASHDLQEPLRAVTTYIQLLQASYKSGVPNEKADEYVRFAVDGVERMRRLINDLLDYSSGRSRELRLKHKSLEDILRQAMQNLQSSINSSHAVITYDHLPVVKADEFQMVQLFQNLLRNAMRYKSEEEPKIHISAKKQNNHWCICVCDNGMGINPEYHEKIFRIFQRLHDREQYPGTGIGLAICKLILERHGGRIWVESQVGKGSSFYFTLPFIRRRRHFRRALGNRIRSKTNLIKNIL
jgi:PAS domain S-box-containing protein